MNRFWNPVIEPLLQVLRPRVIVEIGSDRGDNTRNILRFCVDSGAVLHAIDPEPKFEVGVWEKEFGQHLYFHREPSLEALPRISGYDLVLIDGDHNWYTVFNELRLIWQGANQDPRAFPVVLLHDVGWPYGRRDLYYHPDSIPAEFRHPYQKKGLLPGQPGLQESGGFNSLFFNAEQENQPRSGVLTAIEDFLSQPGREALDLILLPGLNGLGILTSKHLRGQNQTLDRWLTGLVPSAQLRLLLETVDLERMHKAISAADWTARAQHDEEKMSSLQKQLEALRQAHEQEKTESRKLLAEKEAAILQVTQKLLLHSAELEEFRQRLAGQEQALAAAEKNLHEARSLLAAQREEIEALRCQTRRSAEELQKSRAEAAQQKSLAHEMENKLAQQRIRLAEEESRGKRLSAELDVRSRQLQQAASQVERLTGAMRAILRSKRWQAGNWIADLYHRLPVVPPVPDIRKYVAGVIEGAEQWRRHANILLTGGAVVPTSSPPVGAKERFPATYRRLTQLLEGERRPSARPAEKTSLVLYSSGDCESLRRALLGLQAHTDLRANPLLVIDDSQDESAAERLDRWLSDLPSARVERPRRHLGYFLALRESLGEASGDLCLLRETMVPTPGWLEGLQRVASASDDIGLVSPLTNTNPAYEFSMKPGDNVFSCAKKIRLLADGKLASAFPHFDLLYLRRPAFDLVKRVPLAGAGEYLPFATLTADLLQNSLLPARADDTFVFSSKKHSQFTAKHLESCLSSMPGERGELARCLVDYTRALAPAVFEAYRGFDMRVVESLTVGVLYHSITLCGGVLILTEMTNDLILAGVDAKGILLNPRQFQAGYFDLLFEPLRVSDAETIAALLPERAALMATFWPTADLAKRVAELRPDIKAYYFIQDYEAAFYDPAKPKEKKYFEEASRSYSLGLRHITSSQYIIEKVREHLADPESPIRKIGYGINLEIFRRRRRRRKSSAVRIIAMARPETPRRGYDVLVKVLTEVHRRASDVEICLFGSAALDAKAVPFPFENLGVIDPEHLGDEYCRSDIFLETSHFQGFGLAALEAMACGCACVITESGGAAEYAIDGVNVLMARPGDIEKLTEQVLRLVRDAELRRRLVEQGYRTAANFSNHHVGRDVAEMLRRDLAPPQPADGDDDDCSIVIPVYNQLHVVRPCLESVLAYTSMPYRVIVVDDASDQVTAEFLRQFCSEHGQFKYLRNRENLGFVASANRGMVECGAGHIVLLNSDTIVTPGWLDKLRRCLKSDPRIGVVSPLGTASPHLWIKMNPGDSIFDTARAIERLSERRYPDIVTPEGWCFLIRRSVFERLGGFDPVFGRGYCEESDYSMRAFASGFRLACCDDAFVYHEGRATFGQERGPRYLANRAIFDGRWQPLYEKIYRRFLADNPLDYIRRRYSAEGNGALSIEDAAKLTYPEVITIIEDADLPGEREQFGRRLSQLRPREAPTPRVVFLLSTLEQNGGVLSVCQLVNDLIQAGADAKLVVISSKSLDQRMTLLAEPMFFKDRDTLLARFPEADIVVGTLWVTMYYMVKLAAAGRQFVPAYFVQDYEVDFYPPSEARIRKLIEDTYRLTPFCFAKTEWICDKVRAVGGNISLIPPALDLDVFYPRPAEPTEKKVIVGMLRPQTPQRGFQVVARVLARLRQTRSDFEFHSFGSSDKELAPYQLSFPLVNHGVVGNKDLPRIYSSARLVIDFSFFHGFGRPVAEAMACAVPAVVTDSGGIRSFAQHGVNCLMSPVGDEESLLRNLNRLLDDDELRAKLASAARESVLKFERKKSAAATMNFLKTCLRQQCSAQH